MNTSESILTSDHIDIHCITKNNMSEQNPLTHLLPLKKICQSSIPGLVDHDRIPMLQSDTSIHSGAIWTSQGISSSERVNIFQLVISPFTYSFI